MLTGKVHGLVRPDKGRKKHEISRKDHEQRFAFISDDGQLDEIELEQLDRSVDGFEPLPIQRQVLLEESLRLLKKIKPSENPNLARLKADRESVDPDVLKAALSEFQSVFQVRKDTDI